jgi:hypothetical protein
MFEGLVVTILNRYLGAYVTGLNRDTLRLGVWQGDVQLEGLSLRKDALRDLDLPIDVKAGFTGKLTLSIPWTQLRTKPVSIQIDDLYVLAGPFTVGDYDAEAEEARANVSKAERLADFDKAYSKDAESDEAVPDMQSTSWLTS